MRFLQFHLHSRSPVPTLVADCVQYLDDRGLLTGGIFVDAGSTPLLRKLHADYTGTHC